MSHRYPYFPGSKDQGAGLDAATAFAPKLGKRRAEAIAALERLGPSTPDEVAVEIGRPCHIVRPRISELCPIGLAVKTDQRRASAFGAPQTVYRLSTAEERAIFAARRAAEAEHGEGADR
jgi:predicted ArsR family transcriptional regulator